MPNSTTFPSPPSSPLVPSQSRQTYPDRAAAIPPVAYSPSSPPGSANGPEDLPILPPKYTFLPTHVPHKTDSDNSVDSFKYTSEDVQALGSGGGKAYGFFGGIGAGVVLGLKEVREIVVEVAAELEQRDECGFCISFFPSLRGIGIVEKETRRYLESRETGKRQRDGEESVFGHVMGKRPGQKLMLRPDCAFVVLNASAGG